MGGSPTRGAFIYNGRAFPKLTGDWFPSVAAFCRVADINPTLIYGRVHQGWPLIKAIDVPRLEVSRDTGRIYKVTWLTTGQNYIGLTIASIDARWRQHVRNAAKRGSPLARAINDDGPDNFITELVEDNIPIESLPDRERYWITTFNSLMPIGLNRHPGGAMGGGGRREIKHQGETFVSVGRAADELAARHGLTPSAAHQRLRGGKSLDTPLKVFRTRGLGVAGSFLWARWRAMRNNRSSALAPEWQDWEKFAADLSHLTKADRMVRIDPLLPWGPGNYVIKTGSYFDHPGTGSTHWRRWRGLMKDVDGERQRGIVEEWRDFDTFVADIGDSYTTGMVLIPLDWWQPWGPQNFKWGNQSDLSRLVGLHGRKRVKHGDHRSKTYKRWASMHNDARRNERSVDARWNDYIAFREAVGDGIDQGLVLVRPDHGKDIGPDNYKLVTPGEFRTLQGRFTHRASGSALYRRWSSLRGRAKSGGAGCNARWEDFEAFAEDVGSDRPECDLEQVISSVPYGPNNFQWVDRAARKKDVLARKMAEKKATASKREEQEVSVDGVTYPGLYALAEAYGLPAATVCFRVRSGMSSAEAVKTPNRNFAAAKPTKIDGQSFASMSAAFRYVEKQYGIRRNTMMFRLKSGLTFEEAAHKPLRGYRL